MVLDPNSRGRLSQYTPEQRRLADQTCVYYRLGEFYNAALHGTEHGVSPLMFHEATLRHLDNEFPDSPEFVKREIADRDTRGYADLLAQQAARERDRRMATQPPPTSDPWEGFSAFGRLARAFEQQSRSAARAEEATRNLGNVLRRGYRASDWNGPRDVERFYVDDENHISLAPDGLPLQGYAERLLARSQTLKPVEEPPVEQPSNEPEEGKRLKRAFRLLE